MARTAKLTKKQTAKKKPAAKKTPADASWRPWAAAITALVAAEVERFAKQQPDVTVTKMVLDVDSSDGDAFLAIDTAYGKKWTPKAFTFPQFADLHERAKLAPLLATLPKRGSDDFLVGATVALLCLEGDGHLEPLELAETFAVLLRDHGETESAARHRMIDIANRLASL